MAGVQTEVLTACSQFLELRVDPFSTGGTVSMAGKLFQSHPEDNGDEFLFYFTEILDLSLSSFCI